MSDYNELVEVLRTIGKAMYRSEELAAADAIEKLEAENDRFKAERDAANSKCELLIKKLDAAINAIVIVERTRNLCVVCKYGMVIGGCPRRKHTGCAFEWRGIQEDEK